MRLPVRPSLLAMLLFAGCDRDATELIQEINEAREGCTEEELKAGAEECVQMMEKYAEMGTEVIETYIGAVKSLDQALRRMPPPRFDTAGLGHAISPSMSPEGWDSPSFRTMPGPYSTEPGYARQRGSAYGPAPDDPRAVWDERGGGYRYPAPYGGPEYGDPHSRGPAYDPRYPADPYDPRYREAYPYGAGPGARGEAWPQPPGGAMRPRPGDRGGEPGRPPYPGRYDGYDRDGRWVDPRTGPPVRGQLLPPEQRLRRPWLDDEREWMPGPPRYPYREWPDTAPEWDSRQRWQRRDLPPGYPR